MMCGYESTINNNTPAVAGEDTRRLWIRLGVSLRITEAEEAILFGDDREAATEALRHILVEDRFTPDGDSFIPEPTVEEYNKEYGTKYELGEYDFDIYVGPCGIGKENNRWIKSLLNDVPARVISRTARLMRRAWSAALTLQASLSKSKP